VMDTQPEIGEPGRRVTEPLGPTGTERLWRLDRSRRVVRSVLETMRSHAIARTGVYKLSLFRFQGALARRTHVGDVGALLSGRGLRAELALPRHSDILNTARSSGFPRGRRPAQLPNVSPCGGPGNLTVGEQPATRSSWQIKLADRTAPLSGSALGGSCACPCGARGTSLPAGRRAPVGGRGLPRAGC